MRTGSEEVDFGDFGGLGEKGKFLGLGGRGEGRGRGDVVNGEFAIEAAAAEEFALRQCE